MSIIAGYITIHYFDHRYKIARAIVNAVNNKHRSVMIRVKLMCARARVNKNSNSVDYCEHNAHKHLSESSIRCEREREAVPRRSNTSKKPYNACYFRRRIMDMFKRRTEGGRETFAIAHAMDYAWTPHYRFQLTINICMISVMRVIRRNSCPFATGSNQTLTAIKEREKKRELKEERLTRICS